jgi:type II secretory pathway pseudopilin PulG
MCFRVLLNFFRYESRLQRLFDGEVTMKECQVVQTIVVEQLSGSQSTLCTLLPVGNQIIIGHGIQSISSLQNHVWFTCYTPPHTPRSILMRIIQRIQHKVRSAFSIVELVLFVGVVALMAGGIVSFAILSDQVRVQSDMVAEVEQNAAAFLAAFTREVQNADLIVFPALDGTDDEVLLATNNPKREVLIHLYGDRARIVEDGTAITFMTTSTIGIRNLSFLRFGEANVREGVTVTFEAFNKARGTSILEDQYSKNYWATGTPRTSLCSIDGDCPGAGSPVCCSGICQPSGTDCTDPECVTVADCTNKTPSCTGCHSVIPRT